MILVAEIIVNSLIQYLISKFISTRNGLDLRILSVAILLAFSTLFFIGLSIFDLSPFCYQQDMKIHGTK